MSVTERGESTYIMETKFGNIVNRVWETFASSDDMY